MKCEAMCPDAPAFQRTGTRKRCKNDAAWFVPLPTPEGSTTARLCYSHAGWAVEVMSAVGVCVEPQKIDNGDGVVSW